MTKELKKDNSIDEWLSTPMNTYIPAILSGGADYFGLGLIAPLLPFWLEERNYDVKYIGWIQSAQYFGVILGSVFFGRISDKYGRRCAILIALGGDIILFAWTGFVSSAIVLMVTRFLVGCFTPLVSTISWIIDAGQGKYYPTTNTTTTTAANTIITIITILILT